MSHRFCIYLHARYPFREPQVTLQTPLANPLLCLHDGRDLLSDIMPSSWAVKTKLTEIVENLPVFIARVQESQQLKLYGKFHF